MNLNTNNFGFSELAFVIKYAQEYFIVATVTKLHLVLRYGPKHKLLWIFGASFRINTRKNIPCILQSYKRIYHLSFPPKKIPAQREISKETPPQHSTEISLEIVLYLRPPEPQAQSSSSRAQTRRWSHPWWVCPCLDSVFYNLHRLINFFHTG